MINAVSISGQNYRKLSFSGKKPQSFSRLNSNLTFSSNLNNAPKKHWLAGVLSLLIPGGGQMAKGEYGKGLRHLTLGLGGPILGGVLIDVAKQNPEMGIPCILAGLASTLAGLGYTCHSVIDAVKHNAVKKAKDLIK